MKTLTLGVAATAALFAPRSLGQPAWGPVYQWGQEEALTNKPEGYFKKISTGWGYSVRLRPNGSIVVWGEPAPGIGGDWVAVATTNLPAAGTWIDVQAGYLEAIALKSDGTVHIWGYHFPDYYCEGDEITLDDCEDCLFSAVAAGENFFVGIVDGGDHDGDLFVWGGVSCFDPRSLTDSGYVDCGASSFVKVSACGHHILAQKASGQLIALGNPVAGYPADCTECCEPVYEFNAGEYPPPSNQWWWGTPPTTTVDLFSAGHRHSLVWTTGGGGNSLFGWGKNTWGETGKITSNVDPQPACDPEDNFDEQVNNTTAAYPNRTPEFEIDFSGIDILKLEAAELHSTALLDDGTLLAWGENTAGNEHPCDVPAGTFLDFSSKEFHGVGISTCFADANGDGVVDGDDLTYFQGLLANLDISADCNESGTLSLSDYSCFYALWQQGCDP